MRCLLEHIEFDTSLSIGVRTRHRRWMLGMSRQALANEMGVGLEVIEAVESGERQVKGRFLEKLAMALSISLDSIAGPVNATRTSTDLLPVGA